MNEQTYLNTRATGHDAAHASKGFVMIMALVMLVIMGIGAAVAVKLSMTSDMIGANIRSRSLAFQAAEAALKHCEAQVMQSPNGVANMLTGGHGRQEWMDEGKWDSNAITPPKDALNLPASIKEAPQCLIRYFTLEEWRELSPPRQGTVTVESRGYDPKRFVLYRITARGFSPEYQKPKKTRSNQYDFQTAVGAEVRLQSMIRAVR
ncbi:MAG: hypothetical protein Q4D91_03280 [Lautropia sp.]|nr:hypothetical protein [Lautropia sp.]